MDKANKRRWVIKLGSSLITNHGQGLAHEAMAQWIEQIVGLREKNIQVVLVSSGAVAEGMTRLGWKQRPHAIHELQAAAAVGQMGLIKAYESVFQKHKTHTAQVLLTHDDLSNRSRYLNARSTLRTLLDLSIVPIVNENDTVATDEIRFGDNDTLAALVANLVEAERLILLTDQNGMYDDNPKLNPEAKLIREAKAGDPQLEIMAGRGSAGSLGRGGMLTKVQAAQRAARSGALTIIAAGLQENILLDIFAENKQQSGTWIYPAQQTQAARKQWLAGHLQLKGRLTLDAGAVNVLKNRGSSLLPVGVTEVSGQFERGEAVLCVDEHNNEIAYGLANYNATEAKKIIGRSSQEIESILGYVDEPELIHRDNLAMK
ncbi:MAG: glutamate 5-kinase [Gammaproteobacteria bacterium]|nr:glutamate 5-kinase [Gammaproteobacteria bacterium]